MSEWERIGKNLDKKHTSEERLCKMVDLQYVCWREYRWLLQTGLLDFPQNRLFSDHMKASQGSTNQHLSSMDVAGSSHTSIHLCISLSLASLQYVFTNIKKSHFDKWMCLLSWHKQTSPFHGFHLYYTPQSTYWKGLSLHWILNLNIPLQMKWTENRQANLSVAQEKKKHELRLTRGSEQTVDGWRDGCPCSVLTLR